MARTEGATPAYIKELLRKAATLAAMEGADMVVTGAHLETALAEPAPAAVLLERLFSFWAHTVAPSPLSVIPKIVIAEAGNFPKLARFFLEAAPHRMLRLIASVVRRGIARGEFRPVDVDHVVYCVIGPLILSVLWQHSLGPHDDRPLDVQAVCRAHLDLVVHGLRFAPQSSRTASRKRGKR